MQFIVQMDYKNTKISIFQSGLRDQGGVDLSDIIGKLKESLEVEIKYYIALQGMLKYFN